MRVLWLTSIAVAEGRIGVTDRIEGARYMTGRGHEITILSGATRSDRPISDLRTRFIRTHYLPFLAWLFQWPGLVRELSRTGDDFDVVLSDYPLLPAVIWWRSRRSRTPSPVPKVVLDVRSPPVEAGKIRILVQRARFALTIRVFGRRVDAVTTISEGLADEIARLARLDRSAVRVWHSGCSWCDSELPALPWPAEIPTDAKEKFVLFYHGFMTSGRGLFEAIRALDLARRIAPDMLLILLGTGAAVPDLKLLTKRLRLQDHVRFIEPVPHERVPELLQAADVGVVPLPRKWEWELSSPLKLAEYLCAGLPVVVTDIQAHRIIPREAPFAFWSPTGSPQDLSRAFLEARARRQDLPEFGRAAREWAAPRLGWSHQFEILESVLNSVAGSDQT